MAHQPWQSAPDLGAYLALTRPDHWFKNVFMILGALLAFFMRPVPLTADRWIALLLAFAASCILASSNYVLNELCDARFDLHHPSKRFRPVPSGRVARLPTFALWGLLGIAGVSLAAAVNRPVLLSALAFWISGVLYNVPPVRTKDLPYLDVLSESLNNPLRLFLGWFSLIPDLVPPISLILAYWMAGAFFMGVKRFAEFRALADPQVAAAYRASFRGYNEPALLASLLYYVAACALFFGIFIIRYHLELVLCTPLFAGLFAYYLKIGCRDESPARSPEKLYREPGLFAYLSLCLICFVVLLFLRIPLLYSLFNVTPCGVDPLWVF